MIDNLMVVVEAEAKKRNHEVVAWALRAAQKREDQERIILNNPGCDFGRIYTVEELKSKPLGTIFHHSRLGRCWIESRNCMRFQTGICIYFMQNIEPWDEPMQQESPVATDD